jgi:hypothetical protein
MRCEKGDALSNFHSKVYTINLFMIREYALVSRMVMSFIMRVER